MIEPTSLAALWLVTYLVHSTLLYALVFVIDRSGLLRAAAAREHLWRAALIGALLTTTAQSAGLVPRVPLARLFAAPAAAVIEPAPLPPFEVAVPAPLEAVAAPSSGPPAAPPPPAVSAWQAWLARSWGLLLSLLWLAGAGFAGLRLLGLAWLARRELAGRVPAGTPLATELTTLCAAHRVARPTLSVAPGIAGPISLPNREIVVPPWAVEALDTRQRRALLAHELAHQVRRDPQWLLLALGLQALLWLQPLNRLARRRLSDLAELGADAWAARAVADPRALAECLAECAEHLAYDRAATFGAAMASHSLLVERVERIMDGIHGQLQRTSWQLRGGVIVALIAAVFLLPGCDTGLLRAGGLGVTTRVSIDLDGDTSVTVRHPGYQLRMEHDGVVTFADDESDVVTLEPGGAFELSETLDGVTHEYTVTADRSGKLTRSLSREGRAVPMDTAAQQWLAGALPRLFRESGFDAEARAARLLARGGPALLLDEIELAIADNAKANYLGRLLSSTALDPAQTEAALAAAAKIDSSHELRQALGLALRTQSLDAPRLALLLKAADGIDSDHELSDLLTEAVQHMPDDASARAAWLAAAGRIESDHELGRTLAAGLAEAGSNPELTAVLVALGAERLGSDHELSTLLKSVAPRATDPRLAAVYLAASRELGSAYERRTALVALLAEATLDATNLRGVLDATRELGSDHEKLTVLEALAADVAADPELNRRYREVARELNDHERGQALRALDDATPRQDG